MKDFTTTLQVDQTPRQVFDAINNVSGWWQGEITGETAKVNDVFEYRMKDIHYSKQQVSEWVPEEKVVWLVTDSQLNFAHNPSEWTGTKIVFEISRADGKTQLQFTHLGLVPEFDCYDGCSNGWEMLIQQSLLSLITTGKGTVVFG